MLHGWKLLQKARQGNGEKSYTCHSGLCDHTMIIMCACSTFHCKVLYKLYIHQDNFPRLWGEV